ncbi:MAG TPA: hypothetical protein VMM84_10885 [Pyrinomonadaceae bacterium]|nr:hypothetical protein [Pyrinomonadaceae bacterium]
MIDAGLKDPVTKLPTAKGIAVGYAKMCFNQTQLFERGWSKGLIAKLLGDPDQISLNNSGGPRRKLWDAKRVRTAERRQAFRDHIEVHREPRRYVAFPATTQPETLTAPTTTQPENPSYASAKPTALVRVIRKILDLGCR